MLHHLRWTLRREGFWGVVMTLVGDRTVGGRSVPTSWKSWRRESGSSTLVAHVANDAFALALRRVYPVGGRNDDEGPVHDLNRAEARWLAGVVIRWFVMDWFGFRRRIYYAALTRHLDRSRSSRGSGVAPEPSAGDGGSVTPGPRPDSSPEWWKAVQAHQSKSVGLDDWLSEHPERRVQRLREAGL